MPTKRRKQGQDPAHEQSRWQHHPFDRVFKTIAERAAEALLGWLIEVLNWPPTKLVEDKRSKELVASEQEVDVLWLVEVDQERELLHLEAELEDKGARMGARMAAYALQLLERDQLPVHSVVLFIKRKVTVSESPFVMGTQRRQYLRFEFDTIKLWEVPADTVLKRPVHYLWPLAGLMAGMSPTRVVEVAGQMVAAVSAVEDQKELVGMLVVLAGIQFEKEALRAALRRNPMVDELLQHSSMAQAWHAEGEALGRVSEAAELAQRVLERHLGGELSPDLLEQLRQAPKETLEALVVEGATLTLDQVRERLGLR